MKILKGLFFAILFVVLMPLWLPFMIMSWAYEVVVKEPRIGGHEYDRDEE